MAIIVAAAMPQEIVWNSPENCHKYDIQMIEIESQIKSRQWIHNKDFKSFEDELINRRTQFMFGEETVKYIPGDSELDDLSLEELLSYEV